MTTVNNMAMTLKQYLAQPDPQPHVVVNLSESEYRFCGMAICIVDNRVCVSKLVMVVAYPQYRYVLTDASDTLYTIDEYGNKKTASVFHINN